MDVKECYGRESARNIKCNCHSFVRFFVHSFIHSFNDYILPYRVPDPV